MTSDSIRPSDGFLTREYSHEDRLGMYPAGIVKIRPNTRGKKFATADNKKLKIKQEDQRDRIREGEGFTVTPVFNDVVDDTVRNTIMFDYDGDIDCNPQMINMIRNFIGYGFMVVRTPGRNGVQIMIQGVTEFTGKKQNIPFVDANGNESCLEVSGFMSHGMGAGTHVDQVKGKDPMRRPGEPYAVLGGRDNPKIFDAKGGTYRDTVKKFCERLGISEEFDRHYNDQRVQVLDRIDTDESSGKQRAVFKDRPGAAGGDDDDDDNDNNGNNHEKQDTAINNTTTTTTTTPNTPTNNTNNTNTTPATTATTTTRLDSFEDEKVEYGQLKDNHRHGGYPKQVKKKIHELIDLNLSKEQIFSEAKRFFEPVMTGDDMGGDPWSKEVYEYKFIEQMLPNMYDTCISDDDKDIATGERVGIIENIWKKDIESFYHTDDDFMNDEKKEVNTHEIIPMVSKVPVPVFYGPEKEDINGKKIKNTRPPTTNEWIDAISSAVPYAVIKDEKADNIYVMDNMRYVEANKHIKALIRKSLGPAWSDRKGSEILSGLRKNGDRLMEKRDFDSKWNILSFRNGFYDLLEKRFLTAAESCEYPSMRQFTCEYHPVGSKGGSKLFREKLVEAMGERNAVTYLEYMGVALTGKRFEGNRHFVYLHGPTHTGKSFLMNVISKAVGGVRSAGDGGTITNDNGIVSNVSMDEIQNDKFALSRSIGCVYNMSSETDGGELVNSEKIKQITSTDDQVSVQAKHEKGFDAMMTASLVFGSNYVKLPKDLGDDAFFERIILIPCDRVFEPDHKLKEALQLDENERSGIAWLLMDGVEKFIENGYFLTYRNEGKMMREIMLKRGKPEIRFVVEHMRDINTLSKELKEKYKGVKPPTKEVLRTTYREWARNKGVMDHPTDKAIDWAVVNYGNFTSVQNRRTNESYEPDRNRGVADLTIKNTQYISDYEWRNAVILPWKGIDKQATGYDFPKDVSNEFDNYKTNQYYDNSDDNLRVADN